MSIAATILWRRVDAPGHEAARVDERGSAGFVLSGTAAFAHQRAPCCLRYRILLDDAWRTRSATVDGFVGEREVSVELVVENTAWSLNGVAQPAVAGCVDLDLNFSPSTNLLPIRRLELGIGDEAPVRAAWLRFPSFALEPLAQTYRRLEERLYRYGSAGGRFVRDLPVDAAGFVTHYPDYWRAEPAG
jgi:hypothetical protein